MLPVEVEDLTTDWFSSVLGVDVTSVEVLDRSSGTTGRARVVLTGERGVPSTVFVKLPPFDERQRKFVTSVGMGVAEARFYRDLAVEVPVRVPRTWFADTDDGDGYVMVLEDLVASGCRFPRPDDADIAHRALDIVEQLAPMHATFWESSRFEPGGDLEWLHVRGTATGAGGRRFLEQARDLLGDRMGPEFVRIADLCVARTEDISELLRPGTGTLVHGDSHLGNLFVDVDDRTGFLDWAVLCRAPGMRDVSYVLCNSVPVEVRAANERALIARYGDLLAADGIELDPDVAWDQHRLYAVYAWIAAASTAGMGAKWQAIEVGLAGTERATAACEQLHTVDLLESILG